MEKDNIGQLIHTAFSCYEVQRGVTRYLPLEDLKSLRLVNKAWMQTATHSLKDKSLVTLNCPSTFQSYINFLEDAASEKEQEEDENDKMPLYFSNYKIILKADESHTLRQSIHLFRQFWEKCGGYVKELSLRFPWTCAHPILSQIYAPNQSCGVGFERLALSIEDKPVNDDVEEEEESECCGDEAKDTEEQQQQQHQENFVICSNNSLISLHLNVSIVLTSEKKVFPFSWTQFLTACPNICHLSIQSDYGSGHFYRIVNALVEKPVVLKTLKIGTRDQRLFGDEFLKKLVLLTGRETETVSLGFLPSVKHNTPLDYILRHGSSSLKHLAFLQYRTSNQSTISSFLASDETCTFPNLQSFRITKELVPNMAFLCKMPKLRRLEIYRDSTIGQHDTLSNPVIRTGALSVVLENLQSLVLEPFVPLEHVWKLTSWFPNLHRLQMKANDMIARVIFMKWTELRELFLIAEITRDNNDIVRSSLTDEGITGMTKEELGRGSYEEGAHPPSSRTMAYIGNLKKLEICKLQVVPDYQTGLTDYSIHFGLGDVSTLQTACLVKTLVSPAAADMLRQRGINVIISKE